MFRNHVLNVKATLPNGDHVCGPVTTKDYHTYHFCHYATKVDFCFIMQKGESSWYQCEGYTLKVPQTVINEIGYSIDFFMQQNQISAKYEVA